MARPKSDGSGSYNPPLDRNTSVKDARKAIHAEASRFFDALIKDEKDFRRSARELVTDLGGKQAGGLFQNLSAVLQSATATLARLPQPAAFPPGIPAGTALEPLVGSLERLIAVLRTDRGSPSELGRSLVGFLPLLAGSLFARTGGGLGASEGGLLGLGSSSGSLLGKGFPGGLVSGLLRLTGLFRRRQTPRERQAEIKLILEGQRFTPPEPLERDLAFGPEGFGERDFGAGDQPRLIVNMNVTAMDSRSFLDHAPALAHAVREAMLHMHPINQLVRESF